MSRRRLPPRAASDSGPRPSRSRPSPARSSCCSRPRRSRRSQRAARRRAARARVLGRGRPGDAGTSSRTSGTRSRASGSRRRRRSSAPSPTASTRRTSRSRFPNEPGNPGLQGPLLHARVGDRILVHFRNLDTLTNQPHSMHFHGVRYRFGSDGAYIPGFSGPGANVKPGETFTYRLEAGPGARGVWPYHDHSPSMMESIEGGLLRRALDPRAGRAAPGPRVRRLPRRAARLQHDQRPRVRRQHARLPREGRRGRPVGRARDRDDFHTFHVHGHRWLQRGRHVARHAGDRAGGELPRPLARGHAGNVALPLPRREPHDERDDRDLPGQPMIRRLLGLAAVALVAAGAAASADAPTRTVTMPGKLYDPARLDVLVGTTVALEERRQHQPHGDRRERRVRVRLHPAGRDVLVHVHAAGEVRVPLHDPQADAGRGRRLRARAGGAGGAGHCRSARSCSPVSRLPGRRPSRCAAPAPSRA